MEKIESQRIWEMVIYSMRFPLILAVVFIHTSITGFQDAPWYEAIQEFWSVTICGKLAVPAFFFISGYLFFYKTDSFSFNIYKYKIQKRFFSLLIPYLFWNSVVLFFFWSLHSILPGAVSPGYNNVSCYSFKEILQSYWNKPAGFPICFQLWYVRDLMMYSLLSPILYALIKFGTKYIAWLFFLMPFIWFDSVCYFAMGAVFSIHKIDVVRFLLKFKYVFFCTYAMAVGLLLSYPSFPWPENLARLTTWCAIPTFACLVLHFVMHGFRTPKWLNEEVFFIYATHGLLLLVVTTRILPGFISLMKDWGIVFCYFLTPLVLTSLLIVAGYVIKKVFPSFFALVTGSFNMVNKFK